MKVAKSSACSPSILISSTRLTAGGAGNAGDFVAMNIVVKPKIAISVNAAQFAVSLSA
jgi:hypothetical protein